jgi:Allene oxide cyclase barrel like domain
MNKYAIGAVAASAALPMMGLFAPTAGADTTMNLFEHDNMQYQADLAAPGPGPGDQFIFAGDVFDRPGGLFLGTASGTCATLTGNNTAGQSGCNTTFNLAGGQIVIQGVVDTAAALVRGETVPVNVIGGTGIYQNAHGSGTVQVPPEVPNQADANFVLNLTSG